MVSNPITCWSVMPWLSTPRGLQCPQRPKSISSVRVLERGHKVFAGIAMRGKTSMGGFFGFKLHLLVNDEGERRAFRVTPGNVDDRQPVERLTAGLGGQLLGDRGDISQALHDVLLTRGLERLTKIRKHMKQRLIRLWDKLLLRKRALIETVNDPLKNISQIEHSRHRSVTGFMVNLVAGLIAYSHRPK